MQLTGEFTKGKIIIKKPKDIGRLYNRNNFGRIMDNNELELDLVEGVFLLGEGKLKLFEKKKEMGFKKLVKISAKKISCFEIKYLIFKDLRKKGFIVKICDKEDLFDFHIFNREKVRKKCFISAFSERDIISINGIRRLIDYSIKKNADLWFSIVDEEGDITYYNVSRLDIRGDISEHKFSKTKGYLIENRVIIFDSKSAKELFKKEFFGKPFGMGLQLSVIEALYLMEKKFIEIMNIVNDGKISFNEFRKIVKKNQPNIKLILTVFRDLKKRGLIVKTGFKFGAHFRTYSNKPDKTHAEYLIHVVDKSFESSWPEISRAVRLAHSVNKEIMFSSIRDNRIDYIKFGRLRP
jgi:tRNA-intron endonuclease